jgi:Uma2 family endonuclease
MALAYNEHCTVRDYQLWEGDWELIRGAPYAMAPSQSISHQRLEQALSFQLFSQLQLCQDCEIIGEVDWLCSADTVVSPDLLIACNIQGEKLTKTPELIVEVVSPNSAKRDELTKFELYQQEGDKLYILAYPDEQVAKVFRLHEGRYIKEEDFVDEVFEFSVKGCELNIDLSLVWQS